MSYVSRVGTVGFPSAKRTFPHGETYVFHQGNVKNAKTLVGLCPGIFPFYSESDASIFLR